MKILDGKLAAQAVKEKLKIAVEKLKAEGKKVPHLAAILIGDNGASATLLPKLKPARKQVLFLLYYVLIHPSQRRNYLRRLQNSIRTQLLMEF